MGVGVHVRERILSPAGATLELNVACIVVPHGRLRQEFLLRRIEPFEAKERHVRFAHQGRLSPEANQFGRALAKNVRNDHAVNAAGGRGSRSIQVGIAIEP